MIAQIEKEAQEEAERAEIVCLLLMCFEAISDAKEFVAAVATVNGDEHRIEELTSDWDMVLATISKKLGVSASNATRN